MCSHPPVVPWRLRAIPHLRSKEATGSLSSPVWLGPQAERATGFPRRGRGARGRSDGARAADCFVPDSAIAGGVRFPCPGAGPQGPGADSGSAGSSKEGLPSRLHTPGPSGLWKASFLRPCTVGGKHRRPTEEPRTAVGTASSPPRAALRSAASVAWPEFRRECAPALRPGAITECRHGKRWRHTRPF